MNFKDKVVLVTGSSRGIGREIAYRFAREGARVIINYNNSYDEALNLQNKIKEEFSYEPLMIKCDVSKDKEVLEMVESIIDKYAKVDILVNNASIAIDNVFDMKDINGFKRVLEVNLLGAYLITREIAKYMNDGSSIINVASDNGIDCHYPESCDYDASKAGVISLTHNMAKFYSPMIRVNCICPGWIDTDMNKGLNESQIKEIEDKILLKRFGKPVEIANMVLFLASDKASFINDSVIKINGGVFNE